MAQKKNALRKIADAGLSALAILSLSGAGLGFLYLSGIIGKEEYMRRCYYSSYSGVPTKTIQIARVRFPFSLYVTNYRDFWEDGSLDIYERGSLDMGENVLGERLTIVSDTIPLIRYAKEGRTLLRISQEAKELQTRFDNSLKLKSYFYHQTKCKAI